MSKRWIVIPFVLLFAAQLRPQITRAGNFLGSFTSAPAQCVESQHYYDTTAHKDRTCIATNTWSDTGSSITLSGAVQGPGNATITTMPATAKLPRTFAPGGVAAKTVVYAGNSTVSNAVSFYPVIFQEAMVAGGVFAGMSARSDVTNITADSSGNVTVATTNAIGTDAVVGKWITLVPQTGATACLGSGIVSAVTSNGFTYLQQNGGCVSVASTPSTGWFSKSFLNFGNNGVTLATFLANSAANGVGLGGVCAVQPDLLIVRGFLINDVRQGATNLAQSIALEKQLISLVQVCSPATDIVLEAENSLLTTDVGAHGYVVPNGSAQAYSTIIEQAPIALTGLYANLVTFDLQAALYSPTSPATSTYMTDQLHPSATGQVAEANMLINFLSRLVPDTGLVTPPPAVGFPSQASFSPFLAANARAQNYAAPWNIYPHACADSNYYTLVAAGLAAVASTTAAGQTFFDIIWPGGAKDVIQAFDVVEQQSIGCWQLPLTATTSVTGANTRVLLNGGATTPYILNPNEELNIWRPKYASLTSEPYIKNTTQYSYRHQIYVTNAGNGFIDIVLLPSEHLNANASSVTASDSLLLSTSGVVALTGFTFSGNGTNLRCLHSGDQSAYLGQFGWVVGTHPLEGQLNVTGSVATTNCAVNSASPAACINATYGAVVVPTTTTTYTVNTTAVTAASRIQLTPLTFAGNLPSAPTCVLPAGMLSVSAIVAGTSFTIAIPSTTGQTCIQYSFGN